MQTISRESRWIFLVRNVNSFDLHCRHNCKRNMNNDFSWTYSEEGRQMDLHMLGYHSFMSTYKYESDLSDSRSLCHATFNTVNCGLISKFVRSWAQEHWDLKSTLWLVCQQGSTACGDQDHAMGSLPTQRGAEWWAGVEWIWTRKLLLSAWILIKETYNWKDMSRWITKKQNYIFWILFCQVGS